MNIDSMINVTKTFLPPLEEYVQYLEGVWDRAWVTNNGPLVLELERKLSEYLDVPFLQYVSNGTIAIQIALKALNVTKHVITTPFSYVATTTSIIWEHCQPVFADIDPETFCIDPNAIESLITHDTQAILATHVYGYPCAVERIDQIAQKHGLKVIYDAAHAFGTKLNGTSILNFGDLSTLSFHATKLFHTIEGGAIVGKEPELSDSIWNLKSFGHKFDDYFCVGINGKNSEMHAAMGLCLLPRMRQFIARRKELCESYDNRLADLNLVTPRKVVGLEYNYAYYPVVFENLEELLRVKGALETKGINTRRYFYPSLNTLPYLDGEACPVSEDISQRVLCLPLFVELELAQVEEICNIVSQVLARRGKSATVN